MRPLACGVEKRNAQLLRLSVLAVTFLSNWISSECLPRTVQMASIKKRWVMSSESLMMVIFCGEILLFVMLKWLLIWRCCWRSLTRSLFSSSVLETNSRCNFCSNSLKYSRVKTQTLLLHHVSHGKRSHCFGTMNIVQLMESINSVMRDITFSILGCFRDINWVPWIPKVFYFM